MTSQSKLDPSSFIVVHRPKTKNPTSLLRKGTTSQGKILGQKRFRQSNQGSCNNSFRRKTFWGYWHLKHLKKYVNVKLYFICIHSAHIKSYIGAQVWYGVVISVCRLGKEIFFTVKAVKLFDNPKAPHFQTRSKFFWGPINFIWQISDLNMWEDYLFSYLYKLWAQLRVWFEENLTNYPEQSKQ